LIWSVIIVLAIWDGVWKLIAIWKSARDNQVVKDERQLAG